MTSRRGILSLLALATLSCAPRAATTTAARSVLLVSVPEQAGWQDLAYLAAVPAAVQANGGPGAAIALDATATITPEIADYLKRYKPERVYYVGSKPLASPPGIGALRVLPASSADGAACTLARTFWTVSPRVVLCQEEDYASALMASVLAARLRAPLLVCARDGLSRQAIEQCERLKAKELLFVGQPPEGLIDKVGTLPEIQTVVTLPDVRDVLDWMRKQGLGADYYALVNARDRSAAAIRKLSLAAPLLAAARDGMVVPLDLDVGWRVPFTGTPIKGDVPAGIPESKTPPKQGVIELTEGKAPFVVSAGKSGKDFRLNLDLNGDGRFDGKDEGPLKTACVVPLLGKPRTLGFDRKWGSGKFDVSVSTVRAEEICSDLRKLYEDVGVPDYLCIVGLPDAIPQAIVPNGATDMTTDLFYGNADDDLFSEIAVGRVIAESAAFATLYANRVVTYDSLLDPTWSGKAGQARWENTYTPVFQNVGLDAAAFHDVQHLKWIEEPAEGKKGKRAKSIDQESPLCHVRFLAHMAHSWWKDIGQTYDMDSTVLLAPVVVESGGCLTACLDYEPGFRSVVSRFFRNGAVCFVGQTRPGIAHQEQQRAQFWNTVLAGGTIGDAHRNAQNSMTVTVLETGQAKGGPDYYQLHIRTLFGDPGFAPHVPSAPQSAPARVEVKDGVVSVHAPEAWWPVKMRVPEDWKQWKDKPLYVVRGAGTYPHRYWCGEQYDLEETYANAELTTRRKVKSIAQVQSPPKPLGWTGKHTVDEHADGARTYRWRVRLIDFDQKTGKIVSQIDRLDYRVEFEE